MSFEPWHLLAALGLGLAAWYGVSRVRAGELRRRLALPDPGALLAELTARYDRDGDGTLTGHDFLALAPDEQRACAAAHVDFFLRAMALTGGHELSEEALSSLVGLKLETLLPGMMKRCDTPAERDRPVAELVTIVLHTDHEGATA